ncbi:MAG: HAD hydrolase family protein, partial [Erysipelotrichales bacterium]|nr:HAD hydrolase family protein [Erysipelotrichales bacterium]
YVFGDSTNDLPMLEHVKHSVLMGNGNPTLKDKVEYITTLSSVDGIENALKHYGLI